MASKPLTLPTTVNLDRFLSVHAHDLRSPFNQVIGFTKMMINTMGDGPVTDMMKEDLNTVYRSGMRSLNMINTLIDIARLKRGEKGLSPAEVKIQAVVDNSVAQWKKFHPGTDTQVERQILAAIPTMSADEMILQQVISGFMAYVGLFCEAKATIKLAVEEEGNLIIFTFISSGLKARMPSEMDIEMIGYINRAFVEMHGGSVRRAEERDDGALVEFVLPKEAAKS